MIQFLRMIAVTAVLTAGSALAQSSAPAEPQPWDKSGTSAGAMINGLQKAYIRAGLTDSAIKGPATEGAPSAGGEGSGEVTISSVFNRYQETYGPFLAGCDFQISTLVGTPDHPQLILYLVQCVFTLALSLTFLGVFLGAKSGGVSLTQLGWSLVKTGLAAFFIWFPGIVYAVALFLPLALCQMLGLAGGAMGGNTLSKGGLRSAQVVNSVADGWMAAEAYANGAIVSLKKNDATGKQVICAMVDALNTIAIDVGLQDDVIDLPQKDGDGHFAVSAQAVLDAEGNPVKDEAGVPKTTGETITNADFARYQQQFRLLLHQCAGRWEIWKPPGDKGKKLITGLQNDRDTAIEAIASAPDDSDNAREVLNGLRSKTYQKGCLLIDEAIINKASAAPFGESLTSGYKTFALRAALQSDGKIYAKPFLDHAMEKQKGFGQKIVEGISTFMMSMLMPLIGPAWLVSIELLMLQLLFLAPAWIHPRGEPMAEKAIMTLFGVVVFLPIYIFIFIITTQLLTVIMPSGNIVTTGGIVMTVVNLVTAPMRVLLAVTYSVLSPVLAAIGTFFVMKEVKSGGTFIGGMAKTTLTAAGATAALAVPALRVAGMAAAKHAASTAANHQSSADTAPQGIRKRLHQVRAGINRVGAKALNYGQDALGKTFGVDDKYMDHSLDKSQNRRGAVKATLAAVGGAAKAFSSGGHASEIISHIQKKGEQHAKERDAFKSSGGKDDDNSTAQALVKSQSEAAKSMQKAAEALNGAVPNARPSTAQPVAPPAPPLQNERSPSEAAPPTIRAGLPNPVITPEATSVSDTAPARPRPAAPAPAGITNEPAAPSRSIRASAPPSPPSSASLPPANVIPRNRSYRGNNDEE
jgi:hypothetical protein